MFDTDRGSRTLAELFDGRGQLIVYHFMFDPDDAAGCPSCSFWADSYDGTPVHLAHRNTTFVLACRALLAALQAYKKRMGWHLEWVSTFGSDFNFDFGASFTPSNSVMALSTTSRPWTTRCPTERASACSRWTPAGPSTTPTRPTRCGIDPLNTAYQLLDLTPQGRDEGAFDTPQAWVRRHDEYT